MRNKNEVSENRHKQIYILDVISMLPTHVSQANSHVQETERGTNAATVNEAYE